MNRHTAQRILVVEDEFINRCLIVETLHSHGFELLIAHDGESGLRFARHEKPDLILLDVRMPDMDGFSVCKQLKADPNTRQIPVIFLTAVADTEQKLKAFALGGVDYITKPFAAPEMLARVLLHLEQQQRMRQLQQRLDLYESSLSAAPSAENDGPPKSWQIVSQFLQQNLAATPSLDALARLAASNRTTLNQDFQRQFGMSVFDWLREQRLLRAAQLLRNSSRSIKDIAASVGFDTHAGFSAAFRQQYGVSPKAYRVHVHDGSVAVE